jgi:hypothetical protein
VFTYSRRFFVRPMRELWREQVAEWFSQRTSEGHDEGEKTENPD